MVQFLKIRDVKSPIREFGNAGIDVFVPEYSKEFVDYLEQKNPSLDIDTTGIYLFPHESVLIPLGIKSKFPANIALEAANKSGVATRKGLIVGACVIDSSYQGEIHAHLINSSNTTCRINFGEKIVQFIPRFIDTSEHEVFSDISDKEFYNNTVTSRGEGGFGSTGDR